MRLSVSVPSTALIFFSASIGVSVGACSSSETSASTEAAGGEDVGNGGSSTVSSGGDAGGANTTSGGGAGGDGATGGSGGVGGQGGSGGSGGSSTVMCDQTVSITSPSVPPFTNAAGTVNFSAKVVDPNAGPLNMLIVQWENSANTVLGTSIVDAAGDTQFSTSLSAPIGEMVARVVTPQGPCDQTDTLRTLFCASLLEENFNTPLNPAVWAVTGDASWDPNGWIEMTGVQQGRKGAIYNQQTDIAGGDASTSFKIFTGGGSSPGADGFAMTIVDTQNTNELATITSNALTGGGLGYGVGGSYGNWLGEAVTIEIDTWHNIFNGSNEFHTDPTSVNHLELTLNADPGNSIAFTEVPGIEDQVWHDIRVDIVGPRIMVFYDDVLRIDHVEPALSFKGGYVIFSGSTGFYYNYHRFDDLSVLHDCF